MWQSLRKSLSTTLDYVLVDRYEMLTGLMLLVSHLNRLPGHHSDIVIDSPFLLGGVKRKRGKKEEGRKRLWDHNIK